MNQCTFCSFCCAFVDVSSGMFDWGQDVPVCVCVCACALEDTLNAKEKEVFGIGEKE